MQYVQAKPEYYIQIMDLTDCRLLTDLILLSEYVLPTQHTRGSKLLDGDFAFVIKKPNKCVEKVIAGCRLTTPVGNYCVKLHAKLAGKDYLTHYLYDAVFYDVVDYPDTLQVYIKYSHQESVNYEGYLPVAGGLAAIDDEPPGPPETPETLFATLW